MDSKKVIRLASKFENRKDTQHPICQGKHYEGGFVVTTNLQILAKCKLDYPEENEGKTFDSASGRELSDKHPSCDQVLEPYRGERLRDLISVTIDRKKARETVKTAQALEGAAGRFVSIAVNEETAYFDSELFAKFLDALDLYDINTIYFRPKYTTRFAAYAKADDGSEFVIMPRLKSGEDEPLCINGQIDGELLRKQAAELSKEIATETEYFEKVPDKFSAEATRRDRGIQKLKKRLAVIESAIDGNTPAKKYERAACFKVSTTEEICTQEPEESTPEQANDCPGTPERPVMDEDELTRRVVEGLKANERRRAERLESGDIMPHYNPKKYNPMPIEQIADDPSVEYRVYAKIQRGDKFVNKSRPVVSGAKAVEIYNSEIDKARHCDDNGQICQIRHIRKGVVSEWLWTQAEWKANYYDIDAGGGVGWGGKYSKSAEAFLLYTVLQNETGKQAQSITKHLKSCGIRDWGSLSKEGLYRIRDEFKATCAPASAKTYMAVLKSFLVRHEDEHPEICREYRDILKIKADRPMKTWLDKEELARLEGVETTNDLEALVKARFLIGAYTGMRISDATDVTESNERGGMLTYVSLKTGIKATVPCTKKVKDLIAFVRANDRDMTLMYYNRKIRDLCRRAGIDTIVKTHHGGKTYEGPKWKFVSSHTARISFATNLANLGVPLIELAGMMGHSSVQMTERYIAGKIIELSPKAMTYFD
nr:MAG TPA: Integrase [Caudoviricetes sp.]